MRAGHRGIVDQVEDMSQEVEVGPTARARAVVWAAFGILFVVGVLVRLVVGEAPAIEEQELVSFVEKFEADNDSSSAWRKWGNTVRYLEDAGVSLDLSRQRRALLESVDSGAEVNLHTLSAVSKTSVLRGAEAQIHFGYAESLVLRDLREGRAVRIGRQEEVAFRMIPRGAFSREDKRLALDAIVQDWPRDPTASDYLESLARGVTLLADYGVAVETLELVDATRHALGSLWLDDRGAFCGYRGDPWVGSSNSRGLVSPAGHALTVMLHCGVPKGVDLDAFDCWLADAARLPLRGVERELGLYSRYEAGSILSLLRSAREQGELKMSDIVASGAHN